MYNIYHDIDLKLGVEEDSLLGKLMKVLDKIGVIEISTRFVCQSCGANFGSKENLEAHKSIMPRCGE